MNGKQSVGREGDRWTTPALWIVPAGALIVALAPLPYGYYTLLRLIVCDCAAYLAVAGHKRGITTVVTVAMAVVALVFNPLTPIYLDRAIWAPIDVLTAILFAGHWLLFRRL